MRRRLAWVAAGAVAASAVGSAAGPDPASVLFGTAHPGLVEAVDPAGRWIVVCQARADTDGDGKIAVSLGCHGEPYGDDMVPYLVIGGGEGIAIDRFLGVDPTSRWVVGAPKDRVTLYDTRTGAAVDLTPAPAKEGEPTHVERWASFDDASRRLLTARVHGADATAVTRLVVRDLATGAETSIDPGPGLFVRAHLSGDGAAIAATVVPGDSNGDGKVEPPRLRGSFYRGGCAGPARSYSVFGWSGDKPITRVIAVDGSFRRDVPDFLRFVGRRWVRRLEDGALVLDGADGAAVPIAAAERKAKLLGIDDAKGLVLFAPSVGDEWPVFAADASGVRDLGVHVEPDRHPRDRTWRPPGRVTQIGPEDEFSFDWSKGAPIDLKGKVLACEGSDVLVLRRAGLVVVDLDTRVEYALPAKVERDDDEVWRAGPLAATSGLVIDVVRAKVVGTYPFPSGFPFPTNFDPVWGLRDDGALLRSRPAATITGEGWHDMLLPRGPFRWEAPAPPK